ncbi:MAG: hypothetical protein ACE14O_01405 [Candidatus Cloacimonadaceae bacterium]
MKQSMLLILVWFSALNVFCVEPFYFRLGMMHSSIPNIKRYQVENSYEMYKSEDFKPDDNSKSQEQNRNTYYELQKVDSTHVRLVDSNGNVYWTKEYPDLQVLWEEHDVPNFYPCANVATNINGTSVLFKEQGFRYFLVDKFGIEYYLPEGSGILWLMGFINNRYWLFCENIDREDEEDINIHGNIPEYFSTGTGLLLVNDDGSTFKRIELPRGTVAINAGYIFDPQFKVLVVETYGGYLFLTIEGKIIKKYKDPSFTFRAYRFSPNGDVVIPDPSSGTPCIIDMATGEKFGNIKNVTDIYVTDKNQGLVLAYSSSDMLIANYITGEVIFYKAFGKAIGNIKVNNDISEFSVMVTDKDDKTTVQHYRKQQ